VERKLLYWSAIQLDDAVLNALETGETKSLTVHLPTANVLPRSLGGFLSDLGRAHALVVARKLMIIKDMDFVNAMLGHTVEKKDEVAEDLQAKAHTVAMLAAHEILVQGNISEAKSRQATENPWMEIPFLKKGLCSAYRLLRVQFIKDYRAARADQNKTLSAETKENGEKPQEEFQATTSQASLPGGTLAAV
jgi:hypothetical protein